MKKQVIIDKGNGLQQRLSYDDSTNKIIPETTFGPRQTDNVLPVVGKKFIDETDLSVAYGEDCLFCKGKKGTIELPISTQCAILSGIEVSYSTCAGPLYQTTLYNLAYKGIPTPNTQLFIDFYDSKGVVFSFIIPSHTNNSGSFYLHQNSINRVEIRVFDFKNNKKGECFLSIVAKGAVPLNLYKDPSNMKIVYDLNTGNIKYTNLNKNKNLDYIEVVTSGFGYGYGFSYAKLTKLISGKTYKIPGNFSGKGSHDDMYWSTRANESLTGLDNLKYGDYDATIAILGYEGVFQNFYGNLFEMTKGFVPDIRDDGPVKFFRPNRQ